MASSPKLSAAKRHSRGLVVGGSAGRSTSAIFGGTSRGKCEKGIRTKETQKTKASFIKPILLLRTETLPEGLAWTYGVPEHLELGALVHAGGAAVRQDITRMFQIFPVSQERLERLAGTLSASQHEVLPSAAR